MPLKERSRNPTQPKEGILSLSGGREEGSQGPAGHAPGWGGAVQEETVALGNLGPKNCAGRPGRSTLHFRWRSYSF